MAVDQFWNTHVTVSEAARRLGFSRQNVHQRALRGSIPSSRDLRGVIGIPIAYVQEEVQMKAKDVVIHLIGQEINGVIEPG
jgi:hypothetical protein